MQEGALKKERRVPEFDKIDLFYECTSINLYDLVVWGRVQVFIGLLDGMNGVCALIYMERKRRIRKLGSIVLLFGFCFLMLCTFLS